MTQRVFPAALVPSAVSYCENCISVVFSSEILRSGIGMFLPGPACVLKIDGVFFNAGLKDNYSDKYIVYCWISEKHLLV